MMDFIFKYKYLSTENIHSRINSFFIVGICTDHVNLGWEHVARPMVYVVGT